MISGSKAFGILAGLLAAAIWGGMYVVSKVVLDTIPPFTLLSLRLLLGAGVLALVLAWQSSSPFPRDQILPVLGVGLLGYGISLGLQFVGTMLSTAATASLVTSASPLFMILFAVWILQERLSFSRLAAIALASAGVLAVLDIRAAELNRTVFWGNLALLGASITWGLYSVLIRRLSFEVSTLRLSLVSFLGGLAVGIPLAGVEFRASGVYPLTPGIIAGVLYLGVISTALAMYLWNKSLAILEAGTVSLLFFAQPVVGAGLGALLLGETLSPAFWLGAGMILAGLVVASRQEASRTNPAAGVPSLDVE